MLHAPITKAMFKFSDGKRWIGMGSPVLINPSSISIDMNKDVKISEGTGDIGLSRLSHSVQSVKSFSMELIFDLVEQFENASQERNLIYSAVVGDKDFFDDDTNVGFNNIHIYNTELCCYKSIYDAFSSDNVVKFSWGSDIEIVGKISKFCSDLVYFSDLGDPLRAIVNLTIVREDVGLQ